MRQNDDYSQQKVMPLSAAPEPVGNRNVWLGNPILSLVGFGNFAAITPLTRSLTSAARDRHCKAAVNLLIFSTLQAREHPTFCAVRRHPVQVRHR